jgi:hypothetical protein
MDFWTTPRFMSEIGKDLVLTMSISFGNKSGASIMPLVRGFDASMRMHTPSMSDACETYAQSVEKLIASLIDTPAW